MSNPINGRDHAALQRHYRIECELANRLRACPAAQRKALYRTVYDELFARVPDHPQLTRKEDPAQYRARTDEQLRLLRRYLSADTVFLEVGAGDCHLTLRIAEQVRWAYGVDVTDLISSSVQRPANFELVLSDGTSIPVPDGRVNVAYSNMLLEHLHPEDAIEHVREVFRVLAPGGVYVCRTPHRFSGPQDISRYFDDEATGFHLKEYTFSDLRNLFFQTGFRDTSLLLRLKGRSFAFPRPVAHSVECLTGLMPMRLRKAVARSRVMRPVFDTVTIVGHKGR